MAELINCINRGESKELVESNILNWVKISAAVCCWGNWVCSVSPAKIISFWDKIHTRQGKITKYITTIPSIVAKIKKKNTKHVKIRKGQHSLIENSLKMIQMLEFQDKDFRVIIRYIFNYLKINAIIINRCRILWEEKTKYTNR